MPPGGLSFLTARESSLWQGVRGWLLPSAAELLYHHAGRASDEGQVVEIGSFAGKSTVCIARALKDRGSGGSYLTAIDVEFQPDFRQNITELGVSRQVRCLESGSLAVADTWTEPISFLYIDGHHGKAHAYADLLVWDPLVAPGGTVLLDDTIGFMMGPNLQLQASVMTGAYELLAEAGGVTALKKIREIVPGISDFPFGPGSLVASVQYVSAWLGAMDPAFRLPQRPKPQPLQPSTGIPRPPAERLERRPVQLVRSIMDKLLSRRGVTNLNPSVSGQKMELDRLVATTLEPAQKALERLEAEGCPDERTSKTLGYLRGCLELRCRRLDPAIEMLESLAKLDTSLTFLHYAIPIGDMAALRLAQSYDLQSVRTLAEAAYERLIDQGAIPEIVEQARVGLSEPFQWPQPSSKLLLREYNLSLAKYRSLGPPA